MKQEHISKILGIHQSEVSRVSRGRRPVSWPLAAKLTKLFPGRTTQQWKDAKPEELRRAFAQLAGSKRKEEAA